MSLFLSAAIRPTPRTQQLSKAVVIEKKSHQKVSFSKWNIMLSNFLLAKMRNIIQHFFFTECSLVLSHDKQNANQFTTKSNKGLFFLKWILVARDKVVMQSFKCFIMRYKD